MNKSQLVYRWLLITGSLIILLGVAHMAIAVPRGIQIVKYLPQAAALPLTLGNIVTALAVGSAGLLTIYCASGVKRTEYWAWTIAVSAGIFMIIVGIGYILVTPNNPFAYLAFLIALFDLVPLVLYKKLLLPH